jgi:hypothetical protein
MEIMTKSIPAAVVLNILSFSTSFYQENYKNRKGKFYSQISADDPRKKIVSEKLRPVIRVLLIKARDDATGEMITYYSYERHIGRIHRIVIEDYSLQQWNAISHQFTTLREVTRYRMPDKHIIE